MVSTQTEQAILSPKMIDPDLPRILRDYADQLRQIQRSLAVVARGPGKHNELVSCVVTSVGLASAVARSASVVICSKELHDEHVAMAKRVA